MIDMSMLTTTRYNQIRSLDISNGEGLGVSIFFQYCPFHCLNCFNSETWSKDGGKPYTEETEKLILNLLANDHIKRLSILGGEPLCNTNIGAVSRLVNKVKDKKIWIYTGYRYEDLGNKLDLIANADVLVDGRYIDELRDMNLKFRGSSNQRIIDIKQSMLDGTVRCKHIT